MSKSKKTSNTKIPKIFFEDNSNEPVESSVMKSTFRFMKSWKDEFMGEKILFKKEKSNDVSIHSSVYLDAISKVKFWIGFNFGCWVYT